jgi:ribosome-associated toxin RatA of RatAB toxin-antitoxin module
MKHAVVVLILWGSIALLSSAARAADPSSPHPHAGKFRPVGTPPVSTPLTEEQRAKLAAGEAVRTTVRGDGAGRGLAIIDVAAPPELVWACITDISRYPAMVDNVREAEVYAREGEHIKARFVLGGAGVAIEYYVDHVFRPDDGYMTWTLDYSRKSDLDDSVGFWRVTPHPERPDHSRITYSIEVSVGWWLPRMLERRLAADGLVRSTEWVKREAERRRDAAAAR